MKKIFFAFTLVFIALAQVRDVGAQASDSVTGAWDYTVDTGQGDNTGTLTLNGSSDELSGTMAGDDGQTIPLSDVTLAEDTLSFKFTTNGYGSGAGQFVFSGDTFEGYMNLPSYGSFPVQGTRQASESSSASESTGTPESVAAADSADAAAPEAETDQPALSTRTPLRELFQNEEAKAVLEEQVPGLTTNPELEQAMNMSLREIAPYAPDTFTDEVLQAIDEDLAKL